MRKRAWDSTLSSEPLDKATRDVAISDIILGSRPALKPRPFDDWIANEPDARGDLLVRTSEQSGNDSLVCALEKLTV